MARRKSVDGMEGMIKRTCAEADRLDREARKRKRRLIQLHQQAIRKLEREAKAKTTTTARKAAINKRQFAHAHKIVSLKDSLR